jgi:dienelactone hydrolase
MDSLDDFTTFPFSDGQWQRIVYRKGTGPAVVVMHEMPGITPACVHFACRVVDAGFTVFMPSLFGRPGAPPTGASFGREFAQLCVNREFSLLAANHASPATDWLRALARRAFDEIGGRGVGAVGMCITGNFALTMALDPHLLAPVLSQPALPWSPFGGGDDDVHAAPATLAALRRRHEQDPGFRVIGLRFEGDRLCKAARFQTLERELGDAFEGIALEDRFAGTRARHPHSVLTKELIDEDGQPTHKALNAVLAFFAERLR